MDDKAPGSLVQLDNSSAPKEFVNLNEPLHIEDPSSNLMEEGHEVIGAMDVTRTGNHVRHCSSPLVSEVLDRDQSLSSGNSNKPPRADDSPSLQALASGAQHSENSAAYFLWPAAYRLHGSAEDRTAYFYGLQKDVDLEISEKVPSGQQATTLLDVMTIRAYHSKRLRRVSLGTAVGFRTRRGVLTNIPAIIVFVARKVHKAWLQEGQRLPVYLEGPGGVWCDVDVVEFSYYGAPAAVTPKEQVYTELVEGLRGSDPCIGPGSQVASQEAYGTLGAIVQSKAGPRQVGFLTNRHVAVDLDYPNQKMFHPLPPNVGPGVYLGAVERATSFITDERWYSIFASVNPETFVRADGAFIPFADSFDMSKVITTVKGVGDMGEVFMIDLQAPISSLVGRQVVKVGRSSGLTKGSIMAYALEYNDEKGICFFTDFLIVGENRQGFDLEGDSGSLVLLVEEGGQKPRPVGIIWGGTANRGRLKLRSGHGPENWTSGVDLGRLLECLQVELITSNAALQEAIENQRRLASVIHSVGDCCSKSLCTVDTSHPPMFINSLLKIQNHADHVVQGDAIYFDDNGSVDVALACGEPIDFMRNLDSGMCHGEGDGCAGMSGLKKEDLSFGLNLPGKDCKSRWV